MKRKKVTIVGAGGSGLMCGAMLSKHFDVEIYEKSNNTGGRARSETLAGNPVDWGPHVLRYGHKGDIMKVFDICNIQKPECKSLGVSIYKDGKLRTFASGSGSVLMNKISLIRSDVLPLYDRFVFIKSLLKLIDTAKKDPERLMATPVPEWANEQGLNEKVTDLFAILARATNTCPDKARTSILELRQHLAKGLDAGNTITYPVGGFGEIHKKLEEKIKENNGKIYLKTNVDEIVFEHSGRAAGVRIGQDVYESDYVIAAMPTKFLWNKLVDKQSLLETLGAKRGELEAYTEKCESVKPNSGICLDMVISTKQYKEKSLVIHPNDEMPSIMCIISNTDRSRVMRGASYLTFLGLVENEKLKKANAVYKELANSIISQVYPGIFKHEIESRYLILDVIDGAEVNFGQEQWQRPSCFIPGIENLFNPSDDKKEGHSGGEEIAAGACMAVYKRILGK